MNDPRDSMKNLFCDNKDIRNEADVESLFVERLLNALQYPDDKICRKTSISEITIGKGSKKENYKPDYVLLDSSGTPIIVLDAKSPDESPEDYIHQVSSYALYLNRKYSDKNPVLYTILTNGHKFVVYPWDSEQPVFYLLFEDFMDGNEKFLELRSNLSYSAFNQVAATEHVFEFHRPDINKLNDVFNECHNLIWKKEKVGPTDAFYEFCKIMFIKIREDNKIHSIIDQGNKPTLDDFVFSTHWIDKEASVEPNPFDTILFKQIQQDLEKQIRFGQKKRIFEHEERLKLKPSTIYEVVKRLQHMDLYGIDEDLNGRMFETFLNATVRGRELGQYFTPRGVVHYMAETAPFFITTNQSIPIDEQIPTVLDACCGSGGFLIEAMAVMMHKLYNISHLTDLERENYENEIKNNHLYGMEANEKIARVSRLNMYLHGDGGSKIFKVEDSLDKKLKVEDGLDYEEKEDMEEIKEELIENNLQFDIILTNPPFSMSYSSKDRHEKKVLEQYTIARTSAGAMSSSEKSNVLFLERYSELLTPGSGEILTIIDDTVLNGENSQKYRDFILENFVIVQIVSLPFNTFFKAEANIKTSMIHLRKKKPGEKQGSVFMAITNNVGHDDHCRSTPDRNNLHKVADVFHCWRNGETIEDKIIYNEHPDEPLGCPLQIFEVSADELDTKRLDAFYYAPELKKLRENLDKLVEKGKMDVYKGSEFEIIENIKAKDKDKLSGNIFKYIEIGDVTIDGMIINYREDYFEELPTRARLLVQKGDVVFAKNNSSRGTTVLIPEWYDNNLVTTGFIGIKPKDEEEALILWNAMESEFFRKQVYYLAITASQPEVRENIFKQEMFIPWPKTEDDKRRILDNARAVESTRNNLTKSLNTAKKSFDNLIN